MPKPACHLSQPDGGPGNSGSGTQSVSDGKLVSFENSFLADNDQGFTPITPTALTQPTGGQIWLSGVGNDANPGGRTNPVLSLGNALAKTTAGGEIDLLDPASIGQATINHSVTVDGTGVVMAGIIVSSNAGIVVNAGAGDVVILRHLTFNGLGAPGSSGIQILQAAAVYIEDCTFENFGGVAINFTPTNAGAQLFVSDVHITNSAGGGILVKPNGVAARAFIDGAEISASGKGVEVDDRGIAIVTNSIASGNTNAGFQVVSASSAATLELVNSTTTNNAAAGVVSSGAKATLRYFNLTATGNSNVAAQSVLSGAIDASGSNFLADNSKGFSAISFDLSGVAGATRTWVSGLTGNDSNPGSRTLPDATFSTAMARTASGGEVDVLDAGSFGPVTVTSSMIIDGSDMLAGIQITSGAAITINAGAHAVVILRGLHLNGIGLGNNGIIILSAAAVFIEDCVIENFTDNGIEFDSSATGAQLFVSNTKVLNNGNGGILAAGSVVSSMTVHNSQVNGNGFGVESKDNSDTTIDNSSVAGNSLNGIEALTDSGSSPTINIANTVASNEGEDGVLSSGANSKINYFNLTATGNSQLGAISQTDGSLTNAGNNLIANNSTSFVPLTSITIAGAGSTNTWISGTGDDTSPGTRDAPVKSLTTALSKTAPAGEIDIATSGQLGAATISHAVTIDGTGQKALILASSGAAITINAGPNDVVILRHLILQGSGGGVNGITIVSAAAVYIEDCDIENFSGAAIDFESTAAGAQLFVDGTELLNSGTGLLVKPNAVAAAAYANGVLAAGNGVGVEIDDNATATVSNSGSVGNTGNGFQVLAASTSSVMNLRGVVASLNMNGVYAQGPTAGSSTISATAYLTDTNATSNRNRGLFPAVSTPTDSFINPSGNVEVDLAFLSADNTTFQIGVTSSFTISTGRLSSSEYCQGRRRSAPGRFLPRQWRRHGHPVRHARSRHGRHVSFHVHRDDRPLDECDPEFHSNHR